MTPDLREEMLRAMTAKLGGVSGDPRMKLGGAMDMPVQANPWWTRRGQPANNDVQPSADLGYTQQGNPNVDRIFGNPVARGLDRLSNPGVNPGGSMIFAQQGNPNVDRIFGGGNIPRMPSPRGSLLNDALRSFSTYSPATGASKTATRSASGSLKKKTPTSSPTRGKLR